MPLDIPGSIVSSDKGCGVQPSYWKSLLLPEQNMDTHIREALHCIVTASQYGEEMASGGGQNLARVDKELSGCP